MKAKSIYLMFIWFSILYLFIFTPVVFAQGKYIQRGSNGLGFSGGYSSNEDASGFGCSLGISFQGTFDIGFSFNRISINDELIDDLKATTISPGITIHILKEEDKIPFSLAISSVYSTVKYSCDFLDENKWDMDGSGYSVGCSLYKLIKFSHNINLFPQVGVGYNSVEIDLSDSYGSSITDKGDTTVLGFGLGIGIKNTNKDYLIITPSISFDEDYTTFNISLDYVSSMTTGK